jgi:hypothetical protein
MDEDGFEWRLCKVEHNDGHMGLESRPGFDHVTNRYCSGILNCADWIA